MNPLLGIVLKILSALGFTLMSAGVRLVSARYPTGELIFFRSAFALVPLIVWLVWLGDFPRSIQTSDLKGHLTRGFLGGLAMTASFAALLYLPLSEAVAIGYTAPLVTVVLAALVLKETVRGYRWSAVLIGFAGVLIILWPHVQSGLSAGAVGGVSSFGATIALIGACCTAGAMIQTRRLTATEKTGAIVFYFSLLTTLLGLASAPFGWAAPGLGDAALLVGIGILGGVSQILLTESYRFGDASLIAPFEYTTMIWAILIGWLAFDQLPGAAVVIGGIIVVGSGIFVLWREHRLGLVRVKSLATQPGRST